MRPYCVFAIALLFIAVNLRAQESGAIPKEHCITPFKLQVAYNKTTNLVFPLPIVSIDRGSATILAKKANAVGNILRVKANQREFKETNLTVVTNDGTLYSFILTYNENPTNLSLNLTNSNSSIFFESHLSPHREFIKNSSELELLKEHSLRAAFARRNIHNVKVRKDEMRFSIDGFYVHNDLMFFKVALANESRINFAVERLRLYIADRKQSTRTASQEIEIEALFILGGSNSVEGRSHVSYVIAVPKFTISNGKDLVLEMTEKGGARHLKLKLKNRHIMKAASI
jgi:conjugative transposon TraN protein